MSRRNVGLEDHVWEQLKNQKQRVMKRTGREPSLSEIIEAQSRKVDEPDTLASLISEVKREKKEKKKRKSFMEL